MSRQRNGEFRVSPLIGRRIRWQRVGAGERKRCANATHMDVSATQSARSNSETAVQDGQWRKRRSQCIPCVGRRVRPSDGLGIRRDDLTRVQQRRRHRYGGCLVTLLFVVALLGTELGKRQSHLTTPCLRSQPRAERLCRCCRPGLLPSRQPGPYAPVKFWNALRKELETTKDNGLSSLPSRCFYWWALSDSNTRPTD